MERQAFPASDPVWKRDLRRRLIRWFRQHARDLPWRRTRDPYRIWVSEIMLQQTQVATVIPYFNRFIQAFPTVESLATASEPQVLQLWEGLGYYRRARQLHRAAKIVVEEFKGRVPGELESIRSLPGIGRYTAGAILSISQDAPVPILEANTIRLFARLLGLADDPTAKSTQDRLWAFATEILPAKNAGEFNQALMELGSLVCTPRAPDCLHCPASRLCPTFAAGRQAEIPAPKKPKNYETVREAYVAVWRNGTLLVRQCNERERWAGLWDFPRFAVREDQNLAGQLKAGVHATCAVEIVPGQQLTTIKHGVTRFRITLECYDAKWRRGRPKGSETVRWIRPAELTQLPLTMTARKFSQLLLAAGS